ncbi:hypothetical protein GUITHDRAFT_166291 [Guillardia theta CCMP2712]|uniref:Glycosyl transferase family 1 domain-containing protein n=1 Tax=Guillardia theta (strain CCMP2712) TaxID=905079 RepID=L1ID61_GUITC|nr:hypothetical protein GUITHDRAFT_166291 [Guillardia theta CCMP2712]EKX34178.1 hypothetical protein GUITHDRAFT_166291 [Guillardia theta CCMP2712]|eukprot:XP_005821158.1 hypothetical protein GUITHDRAFT_166291 [Guillardia theta CCMP2712]
MVKRSGQRKSKTVAVVVLGDIARSPRMMNHAMCLAGSGYDVFLVGYVESQLPLHLQQHERISVTAIPTPWKLPRRPKILYILLAPLAAISRAFALLACMMRGGSKSVVLLQNPPSIPTLLVPPIARLLPSHSPYSPAQVVDWHNYGYTIMETTGAPKIAILLAKIYEMALGCLADGHFCVSEAMKKDLASRWRIPEAVVLYDRPPSHFRRQTEAEKFELFKRLEQEGVVKLGDFYNPVDEAPKPTPRPNRPALVVSSTSWTPDEDFGLFMTALKELDMMLRSTSSLGDDDSSRVLVVITGKGPLKEQFEQEICSAGFARVSVKTAWLACEDYPKLLGSADLGVCLHYSSSGLDLPMKVVDMFGCDLPVLAKRSPSCPSSSVLTQQHRYACIQELVADGKHGYLFDDSRQLAQQMFRLLSEFPEDQEKLDSMRESIVSSHCTRWEDEWKERASSVFSRYVGT